MAAWVGRVHRLDFRPDLYRRDRRWSQQLPAGFVAPKAPPPLAQGGEAAESGAEPPR